MKKLSLAFCASFILMILFLIISGGRGYTKDNLEYKSQVNTQKEMYYFENLQKSVVQIITVRNSGGSFGTGFFIDDKKTIVTNYHVVRDAEKIFITIREDEYAYRAKLVAFDEKNDIAIITSDDEFDYKKLPLTFDIKKNESIYTCGYSTNYTVTSGKVIDTNAQYKNNSYIDITNVVYSGNSGGPALNENGEVVGIVTLGDSVSTSLVPTYKLYDLIFNLDYSI